MRFTPLSILFVIMRSIISLFFVSSAVALQLNTGLGKEARDLVKSLEANTKKQRSAISQTTEKLAQLEKTMEQIFK